MTSSATQFYKTINIRGKLISLEQPLVMGILNLTPDSFYADSRQNTINSTLKAVENMLSEGADMIDIGGQSTRPGSELISANEEWSRIEPALKCIAAEFPAAVISVDTFYASVAEQAVEQGAAIINDVSGGEMDKEMFATIARLGVPYVLTHSKGTPQNMNKHAQYNDVTLEVVKSLSEKISQLHALGAKDILVDPGFGFAKIVEHNFELLTNLQQLQLLEQPILVGVSRKSMIWKTLNITANDALNGTTALNMAALERGASILRVHDVKEAKETVRLFKYLCRYQFAS